MLSICGRNVKCYEIHQFAIAVTVLFMTISQGRLGPLLRGSAILGGPLFRVFFVKEDEERGARRRRRRNRSRFLLKHLCTTARTPTKVHGFDTTLPGTIHSSEKSPIK